MKKHFLYAIVSLSLCLAGLTGCDDLISYQTFYTYSWSVDGPYAPSNADKLEAYLIELGAPADGGKLNNTMVYIQNVSEEECDKEAIQRFNEVVNKIDYNKLKDMNLSLQHTYTYRLLNSHYTTIAEWTYPNEHAAIDTVVTHSMLKICMKFGAGVPKYCDAEVLYNGKEVLKTLTENDTVYEATFKIWEFPQDVLFQSHFTRNSTPYDSSWIWVGAEYQYELQNFNAADQVVSSSKKMDANVYKWHIMHMPDTLMDRWLERCGNHGIVLFHIDGKNTKQTIIPNN